MKILNISLIGLARIIVLSLTKPPGIFSTPLPFELLCLLEVSEISILHNTTTIWYYTRYQCDHSFTTYAKPCEKLTFLIHWYTHARVLIRVGKNISFSKKFLCILNEWSQWELVWYATRIKRFFWSTRNNLHSKASATW